MASNVTGAPTTKGIAHISAHHKESTITAVRCKPKKHSFSITKCSDIYSFILTNIGIFKRKKLL